MSDDTSVFVRKEEVVPVKSKAFCRDCDVELQFTGEVLDSYPPQYVHYCWQCEKEFYLSKRYPKVDYVEKDEE